MVKYPIGIPVPFVPDLSHLKRFTPIAKKLFWRAKYRTPMVLREAPNKYWLIYNKKEKTGTGPFKSAVKAKNWYNHGGR